MATLQQISNGLTRCGDNIEEMKKRVDLAQAANFLEVQLTQAQIDALKAAYDSLRTQTIAILQAIAPPP